MVLVPEDKPLLEMLADRTWAIGYTTMGAANGMEDVRPLAVDGVAPTINSTATQNYALSTPVYFVARNEPAGPTRAGSELRAFLAWLQSPAGQEIVGEKYGRVR